MLKELSLTKQERLWLIDLINADITDWRNMSSRPVDEVGEMFQKLAKCRIETMTALIDKINPHDNPDRIVYPLLHVNRLNGVKRG